MIDKKIMRRIAVVAVMMTILIACEEAETIPSISGSFSYADIITFEGKSTDTIASPVWENPTGQKVAYSIAPVDTNNATLYDELVIDSSTGEITVAVGVPKTPSIEQYVVSANATGSYQGMIEAKVNIWVQAFTYDQAMVTSIASITKPPLKTLPVGATVAFKNPMNGLTINTTGDVTIDPVLLLESAGTGIYVICSVRRSRGV